MAFSTGDRDNDHHRGSCAVEYEGGWWFNDCAHCNLNGKFMASSTFWLHFKELESIDMVIYPYSLDEPTGE